jgi:hypothetical protein
MHLIRDSVHWGALVNMVMDGHMGFIRGDEVPGLLSDYQLILLVGGK